MADLTPNNREEYWLQGMVDGQTTLEPNKRREYWYKEIVDAIGSGGGGGTGGGVLILHIDIQTRALDKTWAEIDSAFGNAVVFLGSTALLIGTGEDETGYFVYFADFYDAPTVSKLTFKADTENDYPVAQMG